MSLTRAPRKTPGLIVVFGSGEMSPTGGKIHESVLKSTHSAIPVTIGILETPSGFEVNSIHGWPERMEQFFATRLQNYKPHIIRIRALRRDGEDSTNSSYIARSVDGVDYLYCGAGSPTYAVRHLKDSLVWRAVVSAWTGGMTLALGSATAIAVSRFALPVYEIYKAGQDIQWTSGLNLLGSYFPNLVIIPHWDNQEGEDFDTTRCYMGKHRFSQLRSQLSAASVCLGIDEQTACIIDIQAMECEVRGIGSVTLLRRGENKRIIKNNHSFPLEYLR